MDDKRRPNSTELTRREFLARVAATGGATAMVPMAPLVFAHPLRSTADGKEVRPDYVIGTLSEIGSDYLLLHAEGYVPEMIWVGVPAGTQTCRRGCGNDLSVLRLGDRIEAGTHLTDGGYRFAEWVQANAVVGWGTVERRRQDQLILGPMEDMSTIGRELIVEPYTKVFSMKREAEDTSIAALHPGDHVYYTGSGLETSKLSHTIWAYTIFRTSGKHL